MKNYFERLVKGFMGDSRKGKFVYTTKGLMGRGTANGFRIQDIGSGANWGSQSGVIGSSAVISDFTSVDSIVQVLQNDSNIAVNSLTKKIAQPEDTRKVVEPKEVFEEIKRITPDISFADLDPKIDAVKERIEVLRQHIDESRLTDEYKTLFYLENRKKYLKTRTKTPLDWAMTTRDAVNDLSKRYKLRTVPLQQFYTLVPKEGIAEMKRFTAAYKAITGDEPIYELVVKESTAAPTQAKKDRDPILLANSPLGNFLFIVGVWDEEVEIVDEIIYGWK